MKVFKTVIVILGFSLVINSCGVSGDPGHCYISIDWEYYNKDYGVIYYEDDNPEVPEFEFLIDSVYYDSYPGIYTYTYEAVDKDSKFTHNGTYTLAQNLGYKGGLFHDGLDGADTELNLYLYIYPESKDNILTFQSDQSVSRKWKQTVGDWTIFFDEEVIITPRDRK